MKEGGEEANALDEYTELKYHIHSVYYTHRWNGWYLNTIRDIHVFLKFNANDRMNALQMPLKWFSFIDRWKRKEGWIKYIYINKHICIHINRYRFSDYILHYNTQYIYIFCLCVYISQPCIVFSAWHGILFYALVHASYQSVPVFNVFMVMRNTSRRRRRHDDPAKLWNILSVFTQLFFHRSLALSLCLSVSAFTSVTYSNRGQMQT